MSESSGSGKPWWQRALALAGFPILIALVVVPVLTFRHDIWVLFSSVRKLEDWVRASGPLAPIVFIAIQVFQVVVFVVPGEVAQIAGGYLFGAWQGTLYSVIGLAIGSTIDFFLARLLGVPFVNNLFSAEKVGKLKSTLGSPGSKAVLFLLFLIPGIPKDALCYVSGLSPLRFRFFLLASMVGRLPGVVGSSIIGSSAADEKWFVAGAVFGGAAALFAAGFFFRRTIEKWLHKLSMHHHRSNP